MKLKYCFEKNYQTPTKRQLYLVFCVWALNIVFFCALVIALLSCSTCSQVVEITKTVDGKDEIKISQTTQIME